jgi:uncharacterized protein involved in type VI secretion and phage assembly
MSEIVDTMRKIAQHELRKMHVVELGKVTSVFPHSDDNDKDNHACNVQLKNKELELRQVPVATHGIGFVNIPQVGDLVLVSFINGDLKSPIIIGRLYNDKDRPPISKAGEFVFKPPYSKDTDLKRFHLEFQGVTFTIKDDSLEAVLGKTKVNIKADGDVTIESNAKIELKAQGDLNLTGSNIKIESQQALQLKAGTSADLKAGSAMSISSDANMDVKASAMMNVKSDAILAIKGSLVQIN